MENSGWGTGRGDVVARVAVGDRTLEIGDPAGIAIAPASSGQEGYDSRKLASALAQSQKGHEQRRTVDGAFEAGVEEASQATGRAERAVGLFTEITTGGIDPKSISNEIDVLLGLLGRLDSAGRWEGVLQMARALSKLLALTARWADLVRSLRVALHAAEQLGDLDGKAWALHELGTLHMAAGKLADADRCLDQAHDLRERLGDRRVLAVTDRNLGALCRTLRELLHRPAHRRLPERALSRPALVLALAAALLVTGATAGAMIRGAGSQGRVNDAGATTPSPTSTEHETTTLGGVETKRTTTPVNVHHHPLPAGPSARFSFQPQSPTAEERVAFDAAASSDPRAAIASYAWSFGDGQAGEGPTPVHTYTAPSTYRPELTITDRVGATSKTTHEIVVAAAPAHRRQPSSITVACPTADPVVGNPVTISGFIKPTRAGVAVTIAYTNVTHGGVTADERSTDAQSAYTDESFTPRETGEWSVQSSWGGDESYLPDTSEPCRLTVIAAG